LRDITEKRVGVESWVAWVATTVGFGYDGFVEETWSYKGSNCFLQRIKLLRLLYIVDVEICLVLINSNVEVMVEKVGSFIAGELGKATPNFTNGRAAVKPSLLSAESST
jgi:hypothetical protein